MGGLKRDEELKLSNIRNGGLYKDLDFSTIYPLKDAIIPDIERLGKVRGMRKEVNSYNVILLVILLEDIGKVTLMAI